MFFTRNHATMLGQIKVIALALQAQLTAIDMRLGQLEGKFMITTDDILTKLNAQKTVDDGIVVLLQSLNAIATAPNTTDQAKLQAISDLIDSNTKEISDAITANTPPVAAQAGAPAGAPVQAGTGGPSS